MYCGTQLSKDNFCPGCGNDVKIYKKIIEMSNFHYNQGLSRASVKNLSGAIESLNESLRYNKSNIKARNLLGLVYFEVGETVSALSEWVISRSLQHENNEAERYLNEIQKNAGKLETINQTIKKYNQALQYCKQGSNDLAAIQLKKVLSLNPKLVKGHQLMALLYMEAGKYEPAKRCLRAAGRIDAGNTLTLRYLKETNQALRGESSGKKQDKNDDLIAYKSGNETIIQPANFKDHSAISTIINIVIGVVIGACITAFLIVPSIQHAAQNEARTAEKEASDTLSTKNQAIVSLENQIEELTKQIGEGENASQENQNRIATYDQLLSAYAAFVNEDVTGAGDTLASINVDYLSDSAKEIYNSINATVNEQYIETAYNTGYTAYNQQNYTEAATNLQKVVDLDEAYKDGYAIYYLAQAYKNLGDDTKAAIYYQKVVDGYPGTERASTAQNFLNNLNKDDTANQPENGPDDSIPANTTPDDNSPADNPEDGTPADNPDDGTAGDNPDDGTSGDNPDDGTPGDNPDDGTPE